MPLVVESTWPWVAVPVMTGSAVFTGGPMTVTCVAGELVAVHTRQTAVTV